MHTRAHRTVFVSYLPDVYLPMSYTQIQYILLLLNWTVSWSLCWPRNQKRYTVRSSTHTLWSPSNGFECLRGAVVPRPSNDGSRNRFSEIIFLAWNNRKKKWKMRVGRKTKWKDRGQNIILYVMSMDIH